MSGFGTHNTEIPSGRFFGIYSVAYCCTLDSEPFWPTGILKGNLALQFLARYGEELIQAHARLKLDQFFFTARLL